MQPDIEIARQATALPIEQIGEKLNIPATHLYRYGPDKAKVDLDYLASLGDRPTGKLILVTAITPTPAGEGKTTTTVGLGDALNRIGKQTAICLREPSLGPCFGTKGGAAGGGYAQVVPMEDINLHFTGDFHAIGAANNLLAAMLDNHIYWGNKLDIDARRISWRRVVDMNDRALRSIVANLGGVANGFPRQDGFDITVASEVMAVFCLASDSDDLRRRLGNMVVAQNRDRDLVTARDLNADGAMAALLKDAIQPNLAQTLENNPAFIHGGPFANIAHGCNSVIATRAALKMADFVVTEAGFGADLGAEKFFNIKCRKSGLRPDAVVLVATVRALKMHGGVARDDLGREDVAALQRGLENLGRHLENIGQFGMRAVVAINRFDADTKDEMAAITDYCKGFDVDAFVCSHWSDGGAGAEALALRVAELAQAGESDFNTLYGDEMPLWEKMRTVAQRIYGADDISADRLVSERFQQLQDQGYGHLPICVAKTQYSFSTDPNRKGAPSGHVVSIREIRLAAGAEFLVVVCGDIMTMPGLPSRPAAETIGLDENGQITGLF
ncbi:MAG: formate--tetrahydrofolate ligase [Proteobacteria bacterium]|nr:formate--tetrahydrofolate ligase [Pseudomonadota bacterium]